MRALAIGAAVVAIALAAPMLGKGSAPAGSVSRAEVQRAVMSVFGTARGPRAVKVARPPRLIARATASCWDR